MLLAIAAQEPVFDTLAHAENAAAADLDARIAHLRERVDAILQGAGGENPAVELRRGIDVVIRLRDRDWSRPPRARRPCAPAARRADGSRSPAARATA